MGYWAKLKAGINVPPKPKLPSLTITYPTIVLRNAKQEHKLEFIDIDSMSDEELKLLDGLGWLTAKSQEDFIKWGKKVRVPKKVDIYHPLIIEYQKEIEYRKQRDKEHKFRDTLRFYNFTLHPKTEYRPNSPVIPIYVSDRCSSRAFRIIDTLIKIVEDLGGKVKVETSYLAKERDNASIRIFKNQFSFQAKEKMAKRRTVIASFPTEKIANEFRPMYEKVFTGILEIEFEQTSNYWEKSGKIFTFTDSVDSPLEDQLGKMIVILFKTAQETEIAKIIAEREAEIKAEEQECIQKIEEEQKKRQQELIEREKCQKQLIDNIEQQMDDWYKAQKLRQYAQTLEIHVINAANEQERKFLDRYIELVRKKADFCDPIIKIIEEIKKIGLKIE